MSKKQSFKDNQSTDDNLFSKDFNVEKFTSEKLEELNYYLEVISSVFKKLIGYNENDSN